MEQQVDEYLTIYSESTGIYREKASKFLAFVYPVSTEEEVKSKLDHLRKNYHDANHHCYAYKIGSDNFQYRINDDGEPSGSAGKPIYGQILSLGLSDVLVVVVRYFGGTKLGIPGLIHAYKTAAREALDSATIIRKVVTIQSHIRFEYATMNAVMRILKEESARIHDQNLDEFCTIRFSIRKSHISRIHQRLNQLRNVQIITH
jgi:uncharacterized YigZ family protein